MIGKYAVVLVFVSSAAGAACLCGCYAEAGPEPVAYTDVTSAPVTEIEASPSVVYEGQPVYLYNDRWYYRHGGGWAYYREEPPVLRQHHARLRQAPPSRGYVREAPVREAPPARPYEAPRVAPPAERVR